MHTQTYEARYGYFKDFNTIKTGSLLDFIQDVAIKDSKQCGYGLHELKELGLAWLLQGISLQYLKPLSNQYPIDVFTAVKKMRGVISERGCLVYQNHELVAKTIANWFLFDTNKMKIAKISSEMLSAYEEYDFGDPFFQFQKPVIREVEKPMYHVIVGNKDIDTNMHLNNQKGADLLMDALPYDFTFNRMNILYKKAAYHGDVLYVCRMNLESGYYVHLETADKEVCVAGTFEQIK